MYLQYARLGQVGGEVWATGHPGGEAPFVTLAYCFVNRMVCKICSGKMIENTPKFLLAVE